MLKTITTEKGKRGIDYGIASMDIRAVIGGREIS